MPVRFPMPVRFLCPACHQLLSIGTRKVGAEVECPKCRSTIIVPDPHQPQDGGQATVAQTTEPPSVFEQAGLEQALSAISSREKSPRPSGVSAAPPYDSSPADPLFPPVTSKVQTTNDDSLIVIHRRVLYLQAALLAVVAVLAFYFGYLIGGAGK